MWQTVWARGQRELMSRFRTPWKTELRVSEVTEESRLRPVQNCAKTKFTAKAWRSAVGASKPQ